MSVDAFGRTLRKKSAGERGPPGVGYKLTSDGHYDAENKKLCNIADPSESKDAVNLDFLKNFYESKIQEITNVTKELKENLISVTSDLQEIKNLIVNKSNYVTYDIKNVR